jgi:hypothetical protein
MTSVTEQVEQLDDESTIRVKTGKRREKGDAPLGSVFETDSDGSLEETEIGALGSLERAHEIHGGQTQIGMKTRKE